MLAFQIIILVLVAILTGVWTHRIFVVWNPKSRGPSLSKDAAAPEPAPLVSIIVPAKDEVDNIAAALDSLLAQTYPNLEIIVVDDRSVDATADVVRSYASRHPNIKLVQVKELPSGWLGKPHAMHTGVKAARGEWLLFVDADCKQAPHSVNAGMKFILEHGGDMLSLWPVLEIKGFWPKAVQPAAGAVLVAWFRPTWVNDPRKKTAFANGQWILIRRSTYDAVGGYQTIGDKIVEDIAFARLVKGNGHRLFNATAEDIFTTRMYSNLREIWRGWTRIYYGGLGTFGRLFLAAFVTFVTCLVPYLILAASLVFLLTVAQPGALVWAIFLVSIAAICAMLAVMGKLFRMGGSRARYLIVHPLSTAFVVALLVNAILRLAGVGSIIWRGTIYKANPPAS